MGYRHPKPAQVNQRTGTSRHDRRASGHWRTPRNRDGPSECRRGRFQGWIGIKSSVKHSERYSASKGSRQFGVSMEPLAGVEPAISASRGQCPWPLDEGPRCVPARLLNGLVGRFGPQPRGARTQSLAYALGPTAAGACRIRFASTDSLLSGADGRALRLPGGADVAAVMTARVAPPSAAYRATSG